MPEQEDERTAALCRQAALPMLRQRHLAVVPEAPATDAMPDTSASSEPRASPVAATAPPDGSFGAIFWLDRPR
jgi:hypothetical protein